MGTQDYAQVNYSGNPIRSGLWHRSSSFHRVGLKSLRIEFVSIEHNEEVLRLNLDLLEEKRE